MRPDRNSPFGQAEKVQELDVFGSQGTPFIMPDGSRIYFFDQSGGKYTRDLSYADWNETQQQFGIVEAMPYMSADYRDQTPWVSADGLVVYSASAGDALQTHTDLWVGTRSHTDVGFGSPDLVSELSSSSEESSPSLTSDLLTIYFVSDRPGGVGSDFDVWMAKRDKVDEAFGAPVRASGLNSDEDELSLNLSPDNYEMFFSSNRGGSSEELWVARRLCANISTN
jgi:Tol biopolymer transport system component